MAVGVEPRGQPTELLSDAEAFHRHFIRPAEPLFQLTVQRPGTV
jgi:hypothetical protein